jgi:hypothetical protein
VSTNVCVGYLWFNATDGLFCQASPSLSYGAFVSANTQEDESPDRTWELEEARESALAQLEPVATAPRPTLMHVTDGWPDNLNGTLHGPMAGKRPACHV